MKAKAGSFSAFWPDGGMLAPLPGAVIEVDDGDQDKVAYLRALAASGQVEITEDAKATKPAAKTEPSLKAAEPAGPAAAAKTDTSTQAAPPSKTGGRRA